MAITGRQPSITEARVGVMRVGTARVGFYFPRPVLTLGTTDITRFVDLSTLEIVQRARAEHEAHFTVRGVPVVEGQPIRITLGGRQQASLAEFIGTVVRLVQRPEDGHLFFDVSAQDATRRLNKRLLTKAYTNRSATAIVQDLVKTGLVGFRTEVEPNLPIIPRIEFDHVRRSDALSRIARAIVPHAEWSIIASDPPVVRFWRPTPGVLLTPPITNATVHGYIEALQIEGEHTQIRTSVQVLGRRTTTLLGTPSGAETITIDASAPVDYLVVGGGGGGAGIPQGGGDAGRVLLGTLTLSSGVYPVTVGVGGAPGAPGTASVFGTLTAPGGAAGDPSAASGGDGAAGPGGDPGGDPIGAGGGTGGPGVASSITGTVRYYGGGGGGNGLVASGRGGLGGGGDGGAGGNPGTAGAVNSGGGGGGGGGYAGGSGLVIVRYRTGALAATGGVVTLDGPYTLHTFAAGSGTFTVSTVTLTTLSTVVEDLPVADRRALVQPQIGVPGAQVYVQIGPRIVEYFWMSGATPQEGENLPGTTVLTDVAVGATLIPVANFALFSAVPGWVKIGDQVVRFAGVGPSGLTVPAVGYGSLKAPVTAGTAVTWLSTIHLAVPQIFDPPLEEGMPVIQHVTVTDPAGQLALLAVGDYDGIYEHVIDDETLSYSACVEAATRDLTAFARTVQTIRYTTRAPHRVGQTIAVALTGSMGQIEGQYQIQEVKVYGFDRVTPYRGRRRTAWPQRDVIASPVRLQHATDWMSRGGVS